MLSPGVMFGTKHVDLVVKDSVFEGCYATALQGGGLYLDEESDGAMVVNTHFTNCSSSRSIGGGLYTVFASGISNLLLSNLRFINCTGYRGGGAYLGEGVIGLQVLDSHFSGCSASDSGGGLYITGCDNATIQRTTFATCSAVTGGGMYVDTACADMHILESTFESNTAKHGGGLSFYSHNSRAVVASTKFTANEAIDNGGGIYVTTGHENLLVTDMKTFGNMQTMQSEHPYQSEAYDTVALTRDVIYSQTMTISDATELLLVFDLQSLFRDSLSVYDNSFNRNLLYSSNGEKIAGRKV